MSIKYQMNSEELSILSSAIDNLPVNPKSAIAELEKLSKKGVEMSSWYLGDVYSRGEYVSRDLIAAEYWYKKCSLNEESLLYTQGVVCRKINKVEESIQYFEKSKDLGYVPAIYELGIFKYNSKASSAEIESGFKMIESSYIAGFLPAGRKYGLILASGRRGIIRIPLGLYIFIVSILRFSYKILKNDSLYNEA